MDTVGDIHAVELRVASGPADEEGDCAKATTARRSLEEQLVAAAMEGDLSAVRSCLRAGAEVSAAGAAGSGDSEGDGKTPLHWAAQNGHIEVVRLLLSQSEDIATVVGHKTSQGLTSLHYAAHGGHVEVVGVLLDHNADVHEIDGEGWTALHHSCSRGYQEVAELLLKRNADVTVRTARGNTALKLGKNYRELHQTLKMEHELRESKFYPAVQKLRGDFNSLCISEARSRAEAALLSRQVRESEAHHWHCNDDSLLKYLQEFASASSSVSSVHNLVATLMTFVEEQRSSQSQIDGFSDLVSELLALEKAKSDLTATCMASASGPPAPAEPTPAVELGSPARPGLDAPAAARPPRSEQVDKALSNMNQLRSKCKELAEELEHSWKATSAGRTSAASLTSLYEETRAEVQPTLPGVGEHSARAQKMSLQEACDAFVEWKVEFEQSRVGGTLSSLRSLASKMCKKLEENSKWQEGEDSELVRKGTARMLAVLSTVTRYLDEMRPSWKELSHMQEKTENFALQMTEECRQQEQIEQHLAQLASLDEQILDLEQLADDAEYELRKLQRNRRRSAIPEEELTAATAASAKHQTELSRVKRMKRVLCNKLWRFLQMGHNYLEYLYDFLPGSSFAKVPHCTVGESMDDFEVVRFLDAAGTIRMCRARGDEEGDPVILKQYALGSQEDAKKFEHEVSILATLSHPFLCSLSGVIVHDDSLAFVKLPYYGGGTLQDWLSSAERAEEEVSSMFQRVLQGLAYLHSHGILHRDIKPTNVVLDANGCPHIIDFGLSKELVAGQARTTTLGTVCGTQGYIAPEVLQGEPATAAADLWAFGVMLYTAQFREVVAADQLALCKQLRFPRTTNHLLRNLLEGLLCASPADRLSAAAALAHPYLCRNAVKELEAEGRLPLTAHKLTALREHIQALYNYDVEWDIDVTRDRLVDDVLGAFSVAEFSADLLYHKTVVHFAGELGWDAGGLQKEMYCKFFEQVCAPSVGLFETRGSGCHLPIAGAHSADTLRKLEAVGRVLAKALLDQALVGSAFGHALFKVLIGKAASVGLADLEEFDPQMAAALQKVLAYTGPISDFGLSWDLPADSAGGVTDFTDAPPPDSEAAAAAEPALDGEEGEGEPMHLTDSNKKQYVALKSRYVLVGSRKAALDAIASGFNMAQLHSHLSLLSGMELQVLLCGKDYLDGDMVANEIKFRGFPPSSVVPAACTAWLRSLSVDELHCFLMYCTGQGSIPVGGFVPKIKLFCSAEMTHAHLPRAQTCFNALTVPDYPTDAMVAARFQDALANLCSGFQLH